MGFKLNVDKVANGINDMERKFPMLMMMFAQTKAISLEGYMKQNRKWTDRTSAAKNRLTGRAVMKNGKVVIQLSHGVKYGAQLELAREKRYAIIEPTIRLEGPTVIEDLKGLMGKIM